VPAAAGWPGVGTDKVDELPRVGTMPRHRFGPGPIAIDDVQHLIDIAAPHPPPSINTHLITNYGWSTRGK
jgi:hypothetical protein